MPVITRIIVTGTFEGATQATINDVVKDYQLAGRNVYRRSKKKLLASFKEQPRPSVHPFVWSMNRKQNLKAQRWFHWAREKGIVDTDGTRYKRTKGLEDAFDIDLLEDEANLTLRVKSNKTDSKGRFKYRWTVGTFDKRRGSKFQIVGHKTTGWWLLRDKTESIFDEFESDVMKDFDIRTVRKNR